MAYADPDPGNDLQIDRWHYLDFENGVHDENYVEWKYFNFVQEGLAGYFIYYILDPGKKTGLGGGRLVGRVFEEGKVAGSLQHIDVSRIQFDSDSAGATMDHASIVTKGPFEYDIAGSLPDLKWDLSFRQRVPTVESFTNVNPGLMRWEKMGWLIKMSKARVKGTVQIGGRTLQVDGFGYSDTNWGKEMPFFSTYQWGQYNDESISLVFGTIHSVKNTAKHYVYFIEHEQVVALEGTNYEIEHTEWTTDKECGLKIPSRSTFVFKNKDYTVKFSCTLLQSDALSMWLSPLLPKPFVSEQLVAYDGTIEKNGTVIRSFKGTGFREWSTRTWRKAPLMF